MKLNSLSASSLSRALGRKEISAEELCRDSLSRIRRVEERINAFSVVFEERALRDAKRADERRAKGEELHPLDGIPIALKDTIHIQDEPGDPGETADYEAEIAARCRKAGLVLLGKTSTGWPSGARNPYNPTRVAGTDSGGAAACLAVGEAPLSIGTDLGGALRVAASYCGVMGLRPTDGAISARGVMTRSPIMDVPGPMARCVSDIKLLLDLLREPVAGERMEEAVVWQVDIPDARGLRVGLPNMPFPPEPGPDESMEIQYAVRCLEDVGAKIVKVDIAIPRNVPDLHDALTRLEGFEDAYKTAQTDSLEVEWEFTKAFRQCDILLAPVSAKVAPHAGTGAGPEQPWLHENATLSGVDLAGLPAMTLPCGFAHAMPIGLQLIAPRWHENNLLRLAYAYECLVGPPGLARMQDVDPMNDF